MSFMTLQATAAEPYADGNISTTYITIYRDIASNIPFNDDYVMFRSGQYEYKMYVGELAYSLNQFSGSQLTCYAISTNSGSSYSGGTYHYEISENQSLQLNCSDILVYSNLGGYPNLYERGDNFEAVLLLFSGIALVCFLTSRIFSFSQRLRR